MGDGARASSLSVGGRYSSVQSFVSVTSFTEDVAQSPSPFFRSVAAEADAAAACFLLFQAAAPVVVPLPCFLLGAMELVVSIGEVVNFGEEHQWQEARGGRRCKGQHAQGRMK